MPRPHPAVITVYPKLVVRKSTGHAGTRTELPLAVAND
jgi:hypothetical protein